MRAEGAAALARGAWQTIALGYLGLFVFGLIDNVRGPIFPDLIAEYALSDARASLFFFVAAAATFANNVVLFGWMGRLGAARTMGVYSLIQALGLVVTGFGRSYETTLVGSVLVGVSFGGIGIATNVLVAESAPLHSRRQWLAGLHAMYGASSLLGPVWVTLFYGFASGWRAPVGWLAAGSVLMSGAALAANQGRGGGRLTGSAGRSRTGPARRPVAAGVYYGLICMCYVGAELAISTRLPLYARREWGYSAAAANGLLSAFFIGLFAGRFLFAMVRIPWHSRFVLVCSGVNGLVCVVLGLVHHPGWLAAAGVCLSVFYPAVIALISDEHGPDGTTAFVTSWCITFQALGLMAMHLGIGGLSDRIGLGRALWVAPAALLAMLVLVVSRNHVPGLDRQAATE